MTAVWVLVLMWNINGRDMEPMPFFYASKEDCAVAGKTARELSGEYWLQFTCVPGPKSEAQ